jgi:hypothetical protein
LLLALSNLPLNLLAVYASNEKKLLNGLPERIRRLIHTA